MGYLPLATLAAIHLGRPPGVTAWLTVDGGRGVLQAGGIGNITHHVIRLELERLRRAVGETPPEGNEELVQLILPMAFRNEPTTLTASLRDQSARRGAASPLCRASSDWYSVVLRAQCGGGRINSPKTMIFLVRNQSPPLIGRVSLPNRAVPTIHQRLVCVQPPIPQAPPLPAHGEVPLSRYALQRAQIR